MERENLGEGGVGSAIGQVVHPKFVGKVSIWGNCVILFL